jgi:hypothetical protein
MRMRRGLLAGVAWAAAALTVPAALHAHGTHGVGEGYVSTVSGTRPPVLGVLVNVFGPNNLFRLSNYSGKTVVVLGARREPYLRFARSGVYENAAAPTTYLNRSRRIPASADAQAEPRWRKIAGGVTHTWHEHRVVWSAPDPPRAVEEAPDEPHLVFNWSIPATADGKPFRINGFLGYVASPKEDSRFDGRFGWIGAAAVTALVAAAAVAVRARRARRQAL